MFQPHAPSLKHEHTGKAQPKCVQEFYIRFTEKLDLGLDRESARKDIRSLLPWRPITVDNRVFDAFTLFEFKKRMYIRYAKIQPFSLIPFASGW
jgi:hypothetical protein